MPRFAANLTMLFTELPFMQRFEAAAKAGFKAVEYLFPYPFDKKELTAALRANGLQQVLHNLPAGNWEGGERGIACHPDRVGEFREGVGMAIDYATALGCPKLNCLLGKLPVGVGAQEARQVAVENLRFAARELQSAGIMLLIEPVNHFDIPGFFLTRTDQALSIIDEVGSTNLLLQYDIYHAQRMEGELAATITKNMARIGHIQLADNPGRGEPGTGEINYPWLFKHIDAAGYTGWIGCEYKPRGTTEDGLGWRTALTQ
ncbi:MULTISPECIES: hydroxypyruvate isomerase [unclassified Variovorax]|uniref:hydroxypyruvate isomerase n=1 Tax=unclassified Variovorax TaxID=663243 RepID=UPI00076C12D2|nr:MULTISPECIES: hydroxypyruvate isomerase [unclassified Variovorax]KWT97087.1 Hydroxypyruvate isomerase [Variovorax sp. WDL1]PNG47086.1 Hydroxypyruvate isomerase [Variovorax sp. B2]PNG48263.1 Hydroxypyruvate isomerase [Variovorax sp. B4]VTV14948.1 Hydroxypyruvate isomerase [Variovorax sp. WDL1]